MTWVRAALCWVLVMGAQATPALEPEYSLKAKTIIGLLSYLHWPLEANRAHFPFRIAVLGQSPFGPYLDQVARTQTIHRRAIQVRYLTHMGDLDGCEALFICHSEVTRVDAVLAWAQVRHVLTLADDEVIAKRGVMVSLVREGDFIRPVLNQAATASAQILVSAQLLRFVRIINPTAPNTPASPRESAS